jgi:hypothetical protein
MVAAYQPRQAFDMMKSFLYKEAFFTPPNEVKVRWDHFIGIVVVVFSLTLELYVFCLQVLKLYYSITLQEFRVIGQIAQNPTDHGGEEAAEKGSDVVSLG